MNAAAPVLEQPAVAMRPSRRARRHLVQVVLAVLVLAGGLLVEHVDNESLSIRPFVSSGEPGEVVPVGSAGVVVHGARAGLGVEDEWGEVLTTSGVWVAVDMSLVGRDAQGTVAVLHLEDATGRQFAASRRIVLNDLGRAQPGSPVRGEVLFEVPEDAVGEMTLVASQLLSPTLSGIARIPVQVEQARGTIVRATTTLGEPL